METDKIIKIQGGFIDLLNELEKISIDFVDMTGLYGYIFMTNNNEFNYIIHNIENNSETYTFQYYQTDKSKHNIPNAIFKPEEIYDFEINITKKTFKKVNQYVVINFMDLMIEENKKTEEKKRKVFFCSIL